MKNHNTKTLLIILSCLLLLNLLCTSCSGGINKNEAIACIEQFWNAIVIEDYETAEALLHHDYYLDIPKYLSTIESESGVDFQSGVCIEKYTGFSSSYYDSRVDGSRYELTMNAEIGTTTATFIIEVVRNNNGFGIYHIDINI